MYAGKAYIGNHRNGNDAVANTLTKQLSYGVGDFDIIQTSKGWNSDYVLDEDNNYPEGMF